MTDVDAAVAARLESWTAERVAERLWAKDGSLWAASGKPAEEVAAWLGWLDLPEAMSRAGRLSSSTWRGTSARTAIDAPRCSAWAAPAWRRSCSAASSAGPAGRAATGRHRPRGSSCAFSIPPTRTSVRGFRSWASAQRTLFCVSSKSGSTTEPNAFQAAMAEVAPALDFVAITDPGTSLGDLARAQEFRAIVDAPPDVGGRYSALTVFGLVPAALNGVDLGGLLGARPAHGRPVPQPERTRQPRARAWRGDRRGSAGGTRQADDPHLATPRRVRGLGRAARRREHRQGRHRDRADRGRAGGGCRSLRRRPLLRLRHPGGGVARRARGAGGAADGARSCGNAHRAGRPARHRRRVRALGGRDGGGRNRPRHRPVRPAERAGVARTPRRSCSRHSAPTAHSRSRCRSSASPASR